MRCGVNDVEQGTSEKRGAGMRKVACPLCLRVGALNETQEDMIELGFGEQMEDCKGWAGI